MTVNYPDGREYIQPGEKIKNNVVNKRKLNSNGSKIYKLIIRERLPGLNEYIKSIGRHHYKGGAFKKEWKNKVLLYMREQMERDMFLKRIRIKFNFYENNRKRDLDNISGLAHKVILDAMQDYGIIENDGWKNIESITDKYYVDKDNPRIEIIMEVV